MSTFSLGCARTDGNDGGTAGNDASTAGAEADMINELDQ
jgi:hypothetical protein